MTNNTPTREDIEKHIMNNRDDVSKLKIIPFLDWLNAHIDNAAALEKLGLTIPYRMKEAKDIITHLLTLIDKQAEALEAVVRVADRKTDEFDRAKAAIALARDIK